MEKTRKLIVYRQENIYEENDPRQNDNYTKMVCFSRNYNLGDKTNYRKDDYEDLEALKEAIRINENPLLIKPIYLFDHSGITISLGSFHDPWDSGQIGWCYITQETLDRLGGKLEDIQNYMDQEFAEYKAYVEGEVYGFRVEESWICECCQSEIIKVLDSCIGFLRTTTMKDMLKDMKAVVDEEFDQLFDDYINDQDMGGKR